jgi:cytochrome c peroxidase
MKALFDGARRARVLAMLGLACGCTVEDAIPDDVHERLMALSPATLPPPPVDVTNAWADDPSAAALGHRLFFDPGFSGPLLDDDNDGSVGTLGVHGETGRVSCAGCHQPELGFLDGRSTRRQISLASSWTRRRTPSLLDASQGTLLTWDGRRDAAFNLVFGVIESPLELNSSRLFVAQQIAARYRAEYEAIFGPLPPSLAAYASLAPADAGCTDLPEDPVAGRCPRPGHDDDDVIRVVANMGKAIDAYQRNLACGSSRFDAWMGGDAEALDADEQAGAVLFVRAGCDACHAGPFMTDQKFYNLGVARLESLFIEPYDDPGAARGLAEARDDRLSSRGMFSDGDDGRLDAIPADTSALLGAFRTPSLRCAGMRPTFMHAGQLRSLEDVVAFFNRGGDGQYYLGTKDPAIVPLDFTSDERRQLVAFLRALDGPGPDPRWLATPELP